MLAEAQEEKLITALIQDDMASVLRGYEANPALLPPVALPATVGALPDGTHEIIVDDREIHVAIAPFGNRVYNVSG